MAPKPAQLDFLTVADRAEAVNGKLYMMGGFWDRMQLPEFPITYSFSVAGRAVLDPADMRDEHHIAFRVRGVDGAEMAPVGFGWNRAAPGPASYAVFAISISVHFPAAGHYTIEALIDDGEAGRTVEFDVVAFPGA